MLKAWNIAYVGMHGNFYARYNAEIRKDWKGYPLAKVTFLIETVTGDIYQS